MAGNEETTVIDLEEIVDSSMREIEARRRQNNLLRLDNSLKRLEEMERELDEFLANAPNV